MITWKISQDAFVEFLNNLEKAKAGLHCSISNAWFRGESKFGRDLYPALFRPNLKDDLDQDREGIINALVKQKNKINNDLRQFNLIKAILKSRKWSSDGSLLITEDEYNKKKQRFSGRKEEIHTKIALLKSELSRINEKNEVIKAIHYGEQEAYIEWNRRSNKIYSNSWIGLAEMQHFGVPTRMLDWSESLMIALFFAVEKYYIALKKDWNSSDINFKENHNLPINNDIIKKLNEPCIWILNPYQLAHKVLGERMILDPRTNFSIDYFKSFFVNHNYPYKNHIPIYPPWSNSRIVAQRGMFTIQGKDKKPLNKQFTPESKILTNIKIPKEAAIYMVFHLSKFCGLDHHYLYADMDKLGDKVKEKLQLDINF